MIRQILLYLILSVFPVFLSAQTDTLLKSSVGMHLTYDDDVGFGVSARYLHKLKNAGLLKFELRTNFNGNYIGRFGYEFLRLEHKRFDVSVGLDLRYRFQDRERFGVLNRSEFAIELPIEVRYHFSDLYYLSGGISIATKLRGNNAIDSRYLLQPEIRMGVGYKF